MPSRIFITSRDRTVRAELRTVDNRVLFKTIVRKDSTTAICSCAPTLQAAKEPGSGKVDVNLKIISPGEKLRVVRYQARDQDLHVIALPTKHILRIKKDKVTTRRVADAPSLFTIAETVTRAHNLHLSLQGGDLPLTVHNHLLDVKEKHYRVKDGDDVWVPCPVVNFVPPSNPQ